MKIEGSSKSPFLPSRASRKSRKPEILAAFQSLKAAGEITQNTQTAILGHEVREYLFKDTPAPERNETGLSDETIRPIIRASILCGSLALIHACHNAS